MSPSTFSAAVGGRSRRLTPAVVLVTAVLLAACGGANTANSAPSGGASSAATPKTGGTLLMARNADVINWDPIIPTDNPSIWAQLNIYDQLVRVAHDGESVEPDLATSWDISPDGTKYTFHLRPGVTFSDGTPVKASDVKFSIERVAADKASLWGFLFPKFTTATPDDTTVIFTLDTPYAPFLADLSVFAASIIPETYFNDVGAQAFAEKPIGSGPFVMSEWRKGDRVILKKNANYWDKPKPYLDEVDLVVIAEDNTRMLQVQSGQVDLATDVPFNQIDALEKASGLSVELADVIGTYWIQFNQKVPQFSDVKVRQALNWAVDKQAIIKSVLYGHGEPAYGYLGKMLYSDLKDEPYGFDPAKAKQLLSESKYPQGFSTKLLTASGDTIGQQIATIVKDELAAIGVTVDIVQQEPASAFQAQVNGDYEMVEYYMTSDIIDPAENTTYAAAGDGGSNAVYTYYNNTQVNDWIRESNTELDAAKREQLYLKIQQQVHEDAPMLFLFWQPARTAVRANVHDFAILPTANYRLWEEWKS
jgi:peptide/nickel transport system substrate-binding protein